MFDYTCPYCDTEMHGSFGDQVKCDKCKITFDTEWDYTTEDSMGAWLTTEQKQDAAEIERCKSLAYFAEKYVLMKGPDGSILKWTKDQLDMLKAMDEIKSKGKQLLLLKTKP